MTLNMNDMWNYVHHNCKDWMKASVFDCFMRSMFDFGMEKVDEKRKMIVAKRKLQP